MGIELGELPFSAFHVWSTYVVLPDVTAWGLPKECPQVIADDDEIENEEELDDEELDGDEDDDDLPLAATDDEDEDEESSLEELLAQRAAARRGTDETEDEDELMGLASEPDTIAPLEPIPARVIPLKDRQEFVCNRCRLVKARVQLADAERGLCRDCV
jgi:hypothetical protein